MNFSFTIQDHNSFLFFLLLLRAIQIICDTKTKFHINILASFNSDFNAFEIKMSCWL